MTTADDVRRVKLERRLLQIDAWIDRASWVMIGLAALWLITILGMAASAGRLRP